MALVPLGEVLLQFYVRGHVHRAIRDAGGQAAMESPCGDGVQVFSLASFPRQCWTGDRLQRHGLASDAHCALCSQHVEEIDHLLLACVYNREVWLIALQRWGWPHLALAVDAALIDWWLTVHEQVSKAHRPAFDSIVILMARSIWLQKNDRVFARTSLSPANLAHHIELVAEDCCRSKLVDTLKLFRE
jgi:hypothetical protein